MKKILLTVLLATSLSFILVIYAEEQTKKGYYVGLKLSHEDNKNGSDADKWGMTFGKHLYKWLDAEIYTRTKDKDTGSNDTKLEGALIGKYKLTDSLSAYTRAGVGNKYTRNEDYGYWTVEPGLKYKLNDDWSVKAGVRFRDAFQTDHNANDTTYKTSVGYKLTDDTSIDMGYALKRGDSKTEEFGLGLKFKF